jgi:hypothetical protein
VDFQRISLVSMASFLRKANVDFTVFAIKIQVYLDPVGGVGEITGS